jgi:hypothetical protein
MGCDETKDIPKLLCFFESGNIDQKNYCIKLKDNIKYDRSIKFEIKSSPGVPFSIKLKIGNSEPVNIQTFYDEKELDNSLKKITEVLDVHYKR